MSRRGEQVLACLDRRAVAVAFEQPLAVIEAGEVADGASELDSETAQRVLALVRDGAAAADDLTVRASLDAGSVSVALTELELAGLVAAADGVYGESECPA